MTPNISTPLLQAEKLTVRFGGLVALNGFNLSVPKGGLIGLIGPNGAGKTTVFNLMTGVYKPTAGTVLFEGESIGGRPAHAIARRGIARTFQNIRLFSGLTVRENLLAATAYARRHETFGTILGWPASLARMRANEKKVEEMLSLVGLSAHADAEASSLPYGSQRKLEIARALMTDPSLLLLDEPAAGMNPTEKEALRKLVAQIAARGLGVLVIEHDMRFVMNLCTTITVLDHGEVICVGDPKTVQNDKAVIEAYLGVEESHGLA
ncbi:MAG: ABC transporter ATP-binding protein [Silvanigrellales bacterium]|nr:ABC transporter ATP-binding protein [Silvanigrellales bacterium]